MGPRTIATGSHGPPPWPVHELMDDPACPAERVRPTLLGLERINRLTGTTRLVCAYLDRLLPVWRASQASGATAPAATAPAPLAVLDVATGGGDIPRAVVRWAARRHVPVRLVAVDRHPATASIAAEACAAFPEIAVVRAEARALPFRDGTFDACLCSLTLHHLEPEERPALLRRLDRLARFGFLAIDLVRSPAAYAAVSLLARCVGSPMTRVDGPRSVRRAHSWDEYVRLVATAEIRGLRARRVPGFRVALERLA